MKKLILICFLGVAAFSISAQTKINPAKLLQGQSGGGSLFLKSDNSGNVSFSNNLNGGVVSGAGNAVLSGDLVNFGQVNSLIPSIGNSLYLKADGSNLSTSTASGAIGNQDNNYAPYASRIFGSFSNTGNSVAADMLQFNPPTSAEQTNDGSTWTALTYHSGLFVGNISHNFGGTNILNGTQKVRFTWNSFGYRIFSTLLTTNSMNGNQASYKIYRSADGITWTEVGAASGSQGGWPGYHFFHHLMQTTGTEQRLRIEITFSWNNTNAVSFGNISLLGGYGAYTPLYTFDSNRNINFANTISASRINVNSSSTNSVLQDLQGNSSGFRLRTIFLDPTAQNSEVYRLSLDYLNGTNTNGFISFYRGGDGSDGSIRLGTRGADRLIITENGNVLIGSLTDNGNKMQVTGGIYSTNGFFTTSQSVGVAGDGSSLYLKALGNTYLNTVNNIYATNSGNFVASGAIQGGKLYAAGGIISAIVTENDGFTIAGSTPLVVPNYGIRWGSASGSTPEMFMSGYSGIHFYTNGGTERLLLSGAGVDVKNQRIINLQNAVSSQDAVALNQLPYWVYATGTVGTKNDAGAWTGSGFYNTSAPSNFYDGANSWQHLIEARHGNTANNYAMQIAGSFFDNEFYGRKTNNATNAAWVKFITSNNFNTTGDSRYLGITATASNSGALNGQNGFYYRNATNINTGTLADAQLSANVALLSNADNVFSGRITAALLNLTGLTTSTTNSEVLSINSSVVNRQAVKDLEVATYQAQSVAPFTTDIGGGVMRHTLSLDCNGYYRKTFKVYLNQNNAVDGTQVTFTNMKSGGDYTVIYYSNPNRPVTYDSSAVQESGSGAIPTFTAPGGTFIHRFASNGTVAIKAF
jgi:hypothetical protein